MFCHNYPNVKEVKPMLMSMWPSLQDDGFGEAFECTDSETADIAVNFIEEDLH